MAYVWTRYTAVRETEKVKMRCGSSTVIEMHRVSRA